jgi:GTP-binding protein
LEIRNLAIIAHVDHGKTTLIDGLFRQSGVFNTHDNPDERVMDSGELEKERGITITAKNASFPWKDTLINIVDTPGHADFGGEVERALFMVDGALLLVDAAEGPLPQTRFVLQKALRRGLKIIVVINKVDRPDSRISEVEEEIMELFYDLADSDDQVNYPIVYASAKNGWASRKVDTVKEDFSELLDEIAQFMPPPKVSKDKPFQMIICNRSYDPYLGEIAIGRIEAGNVREGQRIALLQKDKDKEISVSAIMKYKGLGLKKAEEATAGDIALIAGAQGFHIGDTLSSLEEKSRLPRIEVEPPLVSIRLSPNTSPFAGQEGTYLTSRKLQQILEKACLSNVALQMEKSPQGDVFALKARGELQVVVLLEQLRREGYELMVGRPEIVPYEKDGESFEPQEKVTIDLPEELTGKVTEILSSRGGELQMIHRFEASERSRLQFLMPARAMIGLRSLLLTETKGEAVFSSEFEKWIPYEGKRLSRQNGAIVCDRQGKSTNYALFYLEPRGKLFVTSGVDVYEGMVVGEHNRNNDLNANPTKEKKLSNVRSSGADDALKLTPVQSMSLDQALEWIDEDEWIEVTPRAIRIRKENLKASDRSVIRQ